MEQNNLLLDTIKQNRDESLELLKGFPAIMAKRIDEDDFEELLDEIAYVITTIGVHLHSRNLVEVYEDTENDEERD